MITITKKDYYKMSKDYRGIYGDYDGKSPHLKGKRTMLHLSDEGVTELLIEDYSFKIAD